MDVGIRIFLGPDVLGADRHVVGTGEQGGEGHDINILRAMTKGVHILGGGGAGGLGRVLALLHLPQQLGLLEGSVVHKVGPVDLDGQRNLDKGGVMQHGGGQIAAAVNNDLKRHKKKLLM